MRAYSMDLRERLLRDSDAGMKASAVAVTYHVSAAWVRRLTHRRRATGEVAPRQQRYGRRPVRAPPLHTRAALIREQPDRTLAELQGALATSASLTTIWRAVNQLGFTRTKNATRVRTRPPRHRVHAHAPCGRRQTSTFLAALRVTGLTAPGVFDGAIDGESFRAYIDQILVPTLQPGDIVMADNLGAHKVAGIRRAIQAAGATLWYLPPSSPDLKPIELCFAKLKALVRTARCRSSETLWPFLGTCLERFSSDEYRNCFRRCGYSTATRS